MMDTVVRSAAGVSPPLRAVSDSAVAVTRAAARESFLRSMVFLFHFFEVVSGGMMDAAFDTFQTAVIGFSKI